MSKVERWQELYEGAGKPGARVFRTFARRKGEDITASEAQQFVSQQSTIQVFQGRLRSDGKVTASREDMRFQADLLDFSERATSQRSGAAKYALTVTDLFTKEIWVEVMPNKTNAETKNAMRKIIAAND
jgi:glycerol kinase